MAKKQSYYSVRPRYTPGSPAMVDQATAERVAAQEKEAYQRHLSGIYGERKKKFADDLGLKGIAECLTERARAWDVYDLCTEEAYQRTFKQERNNPLGRVTRG